MKTIPLYLLISAGLCAAPHLYAEEDSTAEVDRILSEIQLDDANSAVSPATEETHELKSGDPSTDGNETAETVDTVSADTDTAESGGETTESVNPADDPSYVPAINLENAGEIEGTLEIQGSDDTKSGLIKLFYKDVNLADMVRIFAQTSGANIIIPEGMNESVSGNLNDVYWQDALDVILAEKGYVLIERKTGIYTITSRNQMAVEPLSTETLDLQYITAEAALPAIQSMVMTSNASVIAIPQTNVLILSETAEQIQKVKNLLKVVDRPRRQVFIEAKFVELNDSAIKHLGINWQVLQGYTVTASGLNAAYERTETRSTQDAQGSLTTKIRGSDSTSERVGDGTTSTLTDTRNSLSSQSQTDASVQGRNFETLTSTDGAVSFAGIPNMTQTVTKKAVLDASAFALTLSALQQLDGTRIVSNPKMLVANGQTATIHIGDKEPNIQATYVENAGGGGNYVYSLDSAEPFFDLGVKLEVTPTISTEKNITVKIKPELSSYKGDKTVGGDAVLSFPIIQSRKISTEFAVKSGNTVAIGGLTKTTDNEFVKKVPLLGDLPIIGKYLFTHTETRKIQDEVIIFVTVDSINSDNLDDRQGLPEQSTLIQTWLNHQDALKEEKMKAEAAAAAE